MKNRTTVERKSSVSSSFTRTFNGPARLVFEAWTKPELFRQWWVRSRWNVPASCEMDVRVGGSTVWSSTGDSQSAFFGTYKEVTPYSRLVWTNESDEGSVTTVAFAEKAQDVAGHARLYPSKEALDAAGTGAADAMGDVRATGRAFVTLGASADGHEVVDLAVGRLALHCAEENPDEAVAALDDRTEAVIRELEAQHFRDWAIPCTR
jgi:uncharacterized protein YndB with AHSA1/START domain